jgi:two-component system, NarL family, response regulator
LNRRKFTQKQEGTLMATGVESIVDTPKIKVLIVDDHPLMRVGIAAIIDGRPDMMTVAQAASGEEGVELYERYLPDITLMDLRLPKMSGVETICWIRQLHPHARFVVLTIYEGDEDIHQALEAGAQGYIIKGMPYELLIQALQRVNSGGRFLPPPVERALEFRKPDSELSYRERQVLKLLATGNSNKRIGEILGITEATVKSHMSAILTRLNAEDRTQAVISALQRGLVHF